MGFSEKQMQILEFPYSDKRALICDGAVRSGKTAVMSLSFVLGNMEKFNKTSFAICGKTVSSAYRNIIQPLLGIKYLREHFVLKYSHSEHVLTVSRGNKTNRFYVFGGKDESSFALIQGLTLAGVLLDEVALMPRSFVNQALVRCSVDGAKYWFNCNPDSPSHWFYTEWVQQLEKRNALRLHFLLTDNPSLSKEKIEEYYSQWDGVFYRRYILGEWVKADGLVYPIFSREKHVVSDLPPTGRYFISIDYGVINPFSAGLWCLNDGVAYRVSEYYYDSKKEGLQRTDEEHYSKIEKLAGNKYIERVVVDPSASSFIQTIFRHGKYSVDKAINDVIPGIATVSSLLQAGKLKFSETCADAVREIELYSWDEDKMHDAVIKENDHSMDEIRYMCYTILANEFRWEVWNGSK